MISKRICLCAHTHICINISQYTHNLFYAIPSFQNQQDFLQKKGKKKKEKGVKWYIINQRNESRVFDGIGKKEKKKEINNIPGKLLSACLTACVIEDNRPAELFLFIELSTSVLCDDREFLSE